ncbi:MAG: carboxypeptidase regulatory-like domain-containing protein [Puniceicoccaceae bacterium]
MKTRLWKLAFVAMACVMGTSVLHAQSVTTSALAGVVTDASGEPVAGLTVTAVHAPTGTVYRAVTREGGAYGIVGMRPGGPYVLQITGEGVRPTTVNDIQLQLSVTRTLNLQVQQDVVDLEPYVVSARDLTSIDLNQIGVGTSLNSASVTSLPQTGASLNDFARLNPFVTVNEADRNEMTVAGQNNRFNSIQIDGVRVNDQFGLDSSGSVSLVSPLPYEAIEALNVEISPYDLRQSGFTGASINAVTKSGTNRLSGSLYTRYTDDHFRGEDVNDGSNTLFREWTWGASLGGAIIQDKLFFYVNYEEFERTLEPGAPGFIPDAAAIQQVVDYGKNVLGVDFGVWAPPSAVKLNTETLLVNIDWNISSMHRARFSYRGQDGVSPNFGDFDDFGETALSTNFYSQERGEDYFVAQLFSDWSDKFSTEFKVSYGEYRQPSSFESPLPAIEIDAFPGADGDPDAGELFIGTERFRHANNLDWDILTIAGSGTYYAGAHEITAGFDYEFTKYANLFLSDSLGNFVFRNLDDFLNDRPQFDGFRNTGITGQNPIAEPELGVLGVYIQDRWQVNSDLTITGGVRVDMTLSDTEPPVAQGFEQAFGFGNGGSIDGATVVAPRIGFKYRVRQSWIPEEHNVYLRGGVGLFQGRTPAVWFANAYTNNGETAGSIDLTDGLVSYMQNDFDPNNSPIYVPREQSTPAVDALEEDLELPSIWRGNLALDYEVPAWDLVFTAEVLMSTVKNALYVYDANQPVVGTGPDGRKLYENRGVTTDFREVYVLGNTSEGDSRNIVFQVSRPDRGQGFFGSLSVNFGHSDDVNPFTSSRAISNWQNRAGFNLNDPEGGTSNFEIKERWLGVFGYTHDWGNGHKTRATLVYEGRVGRPFSYTFSTDINGDGRNNNDLLYIPTGPSDPNVVFADTFDTGPFFDFLERVGLAQHGGSYAPRNSQNSPWVHVWDLKITQEIPLSYRDMGLELFVSVRNLGNLLNDDWGLTEEVGFPYSARAVNADIVDGKYVFNTFDPDEPVIYVGDNRSRWGVQFGAKLSF